MVFIVVTYQPQREGIAGVIPESTTMTEVETDDIDNITNGLMVPIDGYSVVIPAELATIVKSKMVNEVSQITASVVSEIEPQA